MEEFTWNKTMDDGYYEDISQNDAQMAKASKELFEVLCQLTGGRAKSLLRDIDTGDGLRAWRTLHNTYARDTLARTLRLYREVINPTQSQSVDLVITAIGKWETKVTLENLEISGAPAGSEEQVEMMKETIKNSIEGQATRTECLTKEQADKEEVAKAMSKATGGQCNFAKEEVGGGKIDVAGTCNMGGQEMEVAMNGTMAPEKIEMTTTMKSEPKGSGVTMQPGMDMAMKTTVTHLGDCDG